jgi:hypothetical protein
MGVAVKDPFLLGLDEKPKNGKQQKKEVPKPVAKTTGEDPFLLGVKKKEPSEDTGESLPSGTEDTSPSKLPSSESTSDVKTDYPLAFLGKKGQMIADLRPERQPIPMAQKALVEKKLTPQDITALQNTEYGQRSGLNNLQTDEQKNVYADLYNQPDNKDVQNSLSEVLHKYPINFNTPEGKKMQDAFNYGNVQQITQYRDVVLDHIEKQKPAREYTQYTNNPLPFTKEQLQKKLDLDAEQEKVKQTFNDYIDNVTAEKTVGPTLEKGGKLLDTDLKLLGAQKEKQSLGNNSFQQRQLLASYSNKDYLKGLKKIIDSDLPDAVKQKAQKDYTDNYLATENVDYDRERAGLSMVINNLSMKYNDVAKKAMTSNPELKDDADKIYDELKYYRDQYDTMDDRPGYADVRVRKVAKYLGDEVASRHGSMTPVTPKQILDVAKEIDKDNPGFLEKYGSDITFLEQHSQMVPFGKGFVGGIVSGAKGGLYEVGKDVATGFGYAGGDERKKAARDIADEYKTNIQGLSSSGEAPVKILFDKNDKAFKEIPNEDYGKINWNSSGRFLGKSLPGLAEFILVDKGLGNAAKLVNVLGVKGLVGATSGALKLKGFEITAEEIAAAKKALSIGENSKNNLGLFGALTITGHEQNRKIADDLIDDNSSAGEGKKTILANLLNISSFAAFKVAGVSPTTAMEKALQKSISNDALGLFEKSGWKVTEEQADNFFRNTVLPKLKSLGKAVGNNTLQGLKLGEAMTLDANTRGLIGSMVNPDKGSVPSLKDDAEIVGNQILLMTAVGLPGLVRSGFSPTNKDVLYDAGLQVPQNISRINKMVVDGDIDQARANELISMVKTMGEEVAKVQGLKNDNGLPLTVKQKRDLAVENFRKVAADHLSGKGEEVKAEGADKAIKETLAENRFEPADEEPLAQVISGKAPEEVINNELSKITNKSELIKVIEETKSKTDNTKQQGGQDEETNTNSEENKGAGTGTQAPVEEKPEKQEKLFERLKRVANEHDFTEPYDVVLHHFAQGGKINSSAIQELFGNKRGKSVESEKRARISLLGKDAPGIDELAHGMWEEAGQPDSPTTQDFKDAIERVLGDFNSKSAMAKDLVERYDWEAAQEKYMEQQYGKEAIDIVENMSEEEINHLLSLEADNKAQELETYLDEVSSPEKRAAEATEAPLRSFRSDEQVKKVLESVELTKEQARRKIDGIPAERKLKDLKDKYKKLENLINCLTLNG